MHYRFRHRLIGDVCLSLYNAVKPLYSQRLIDPGCSIFLFGSQNLLCHECRWMGNVVGLVEEIIPPSDITDQQKSHVRRFAYRLHFTMTQHLRDVVLNSVDAWAKLWDAYTMGEVIEDEDADDFVMPDNDTPLEAEVEEPKPKPYFLVKLSVDKDCKFVFVPELEEIKEVILVMLDDITLSVAGIENLVSRLDSKIVEVNKTQEIHTVTKDHLRVVAARTKIQVQNLDTRLYFTFRLVLMQFYR